MKMSKEDLYKYYRRKTKDEIIEELYYKCNANYNLVKRIDEAIRILNSAKNHYDNDKTNWAIERTLRALKGSDKE